MKRPADQLTEAIEEFDAAHTRFTALIRSGVLAGEFDQEYATEVRRLQALLLQVRARLYQVAAAERVREGHGPLRDDLIALLEFIDEGSKGDRDVVEMPAVFGDREARPLRVVGDTGREGLR